MNYLIGVDVGTTSTKIIAYTMIGEIISEEKSVYETYNSQEGYYEQNPKEIFDSVIKGIKKIIEYNSDNKLLGISFSSAMHSIIAIDKNNIPLTNAILWLDRRCEKEVKKYKDSKFIHDIFIETGTPIHTMSPLFKILWIKNNREDIFKNTHKFISIKEYIFLELFGKYYVDYSIASATGLFNIHNKAWNKNSMKLLGINEEFLSKPVDITFKLDNLKLKYKKYLEIDNNVPFIIGGSDGCMANLGVNDMNEGVAVITLGTSGAIRLGTKEIEVDEKERIFIYLLDDKHYILGGAVNNIGIIIDWIKNKFDKELDYNSIFNTLLYKNDNSKNIIFLPYLTGERAPIWNSEAKGVFFGITLREEKDDFIRAVLEGIIYSLYDVYNVLTEIKNIKKIYVNGGLSKIDNFIQTMADIFNIKLLVSENYESSCFGAFITGMAAIGMIKDIESFSFNKFEIKEFTPKIYNHERYMENYKIYKELYKNLYKMF